MIHDATNDTLTILKFFEKQKHYYWFDISAIASILNIPKPRVKGILTILVSNGLIEQDEKHFYKLKENKQEMINAEEVRKYQKEQKAKIDVTPYIVAIEEFIKESMLKLDCTGIIYAFDKIICAEALEKIMKILKDNGYDVKSIPPSHYFEFGGLKIGWGRI